MSPGRSRAIDWGAWILALVALAFAGWAFRQHLQAETAAAAVTQANAGLESSLKRDQAKLNRQRRAVAAAKTAAQAQAAAKPPTLPNGHPDIDAIISSHPDLLAAYIKAIRGFTEQTYGSLFARLQLSPDQIHRLEDLMINDLENQLDLNTAAESQGLSQSDPAVAQMRDQQKAELQAAEQSLLGPQAYDAFHDAERQQSIRQPIQQLSRMTALSPDPLTADQSNQLVQLMAQSSSDYAAGKNASAGTVDWNSVLQQAPSFLASSQVASLQGVAGLYQFQNLAKKFATEQAAP